VKIGKYENKEILSKASCFTRKTTGEPTYAKASADNSPPKFNAGGPSYRTRKTTGEPSWLTPLEAQGISVSNCNGAPIRYRMNSSFIIMACCRLLTGLTMMRDARQDASPIESSSVVHFCISFQFENFTFSVFNIHYI
jgi:hypothetical protein